MLMRKDTFCPTPLFDRETYADLPAHFFAGVDRFTDVTHKKIEVLEIRGDVPYGMKKESRVSRKPMAAASAVSL